MGICRDPRLTYLNDHGYNVVRLPRQGIRPLGVIGRDHKSRLWLGTLDQIWTSDVPVPVPGAPQVVANLKGEKTSNIKLSFGLEILANALNGMFGGTAPNVDFAYKEAKSVQFVFRDVTSVGIDPFTVGNYLARGDLADRNPFVKRFFQNQSDVEAWVITEILQSKSIGVIGKKDADTSVSVNVPQIQTTLGTKIEVTATNSSNTEVTFEGKEFLTFGFKLFGIGMLNGEWQVYGVEPGKGTAFAVGVEIGDPIVAKSELFDFELKESGPAGF